MDRAERRRVKAHIMSWGTGNILPSVQPAGATATISLSDRSHLAEVVGTGLAGDGTVILAAGSHDASSGVVGVDGSLTEPGTEFSIDNDFFLQTQDYASSEFMSVLGPTLIRISDAEGDFQAFVADVDRAYNTGVFPEFASAPSVRIADLPALGAVSALDGPKLRLHVNADGAISTSPGGVELGRLGATLTELSDKWEQINAASEMPCGVCLGGVVPEAERTKHLMERPFVRRYLAALDALRILTTNNIGQLQISGFGNRITAGLADDDPGEDYAAAALPVLAWNDEQGYLVEPSSGRVFSINHAAARAVECLLATGSADDAARYLSPSIVSHVEQFFAGAGVGLVPARLTAEAR